MLLQAIIKNSPNLLESFGDSLLKHFGDNPYHIMDLSEDELMDELEGTEFIEEFLNDLLREQVELMAEGIESIKEFIAGV